jgi:hypothetical protein
VIEFEGTPAEFETTLNMNEKKPENWGKLDLVKATEAGNVYAFRKKGLPDQVFVQKGKGSGTNLNIRQLVEQEGFDWSIARKLFGSDGSLEQNGKMEKAWKSGWRPEQELYQKEIRKTIYKETDPQGNLIIYKGKNKYKFDGKTYYKRGASSWEVTTKEKIEEELGMNLSEVPEYSAQTVENVHEKGAEHREYFVNGDSVGTAAIHDGILGFDIEIPEAYQNMGIASRIIKDAIDFYTNKGIEVKGLKGTWMKNRQYPDGISTNLKVFMEYYLDKNLSWQEAAFATPTGKIAKANGFTEVQLIDIDGNENPTTGKYFDIYSVEVKFVKPK